MRLKHTLIFIFASLLLCSSLPARVHAEQTRDWMVGPQPGGTVLNMDLFFPGVQAQLEHRIPIYGIVNELWLKTNAVMALPFYESQADVDLRLVVVSLGGSVGFRDNFKTMTFASGESLTREHRRARELSGKTYDSINGFGEARAQLALPFNDHVVFLSVDSLRFEGGPDRVFDWRTGIVRDSGMYFNSNNTLFLKNHDLGSIGPQLQILNFDLDGKNQTQINYGFTVVTRPGLTRDNDIFFLSMLFNFDTSGSGYKAGDVYGTHLFYAPFTFLLAYRMVFALTPQKNAMDDDAESLK